MCSKNGNTPSNLRKKLGMSRVNIDQISQLCFWADLTCVSKFFCIYLGIPNLKEEPMNHKNNSIHSELIKKLDQIIAEKNLLKHPFYQMWSQGKLSLEALRNYAKQYYHLVSVFPTFISGVHSNCPDLQSRQKLLSNLMDEELGERNHPELWLRFCDGLGLRRGEGLSKKARPEIKQLIKTFTNLTGREHYQEGTAALYAYEAQVPEIRESKIKGVQQFYGIKYPSCVG